MKTAHEEHDVKHRLSMGWGSSRGRKNNVDALNEWNECSQRFRLKERFIFIAMLIKWSKFPCARCREFVCIKFILNVGNISVINYSWYLYLLLINESFYLLIDYIKSSPNYLSYLLAKWVRPIFNWKFLTISINWERVITFTQIPAYYYVSGAVFAT